MQLSGALVVIFSALIGLAIAALNGLDGLQAALVCALAWMVLNSLYHAGRSIRYYLRPRRVRR